MGGRPCRFRGTMGKRRFPRAWQGGTCVSPGDPPMM
ncbi:hypothetical protein ACIGB6_10980 [Paeniglutamicibacter gangotriensis]